MQVLRFYFVGQNIQHDEHCKLLTVNLMVKYLAAELPTFHRKFYCKTTVFRKIKLQLYFFSFQASHCLFRLTVCLELHFTYFLISFVHAEEKSHCTFNAFTCFTIIIHVGQVVGLQLLFVLEEQSFCSKRRFCLVHSDSHHLSSIYLLLLILTLCICTVIICRCVFCLPFCWPTHFLHIKLAYPNCSFQFLQ